MSADRILITLLVLAVNTVLLAAGPEIQWEKTYGLIEKDEAAKSVLQTNDGGFIIIGHNEQIDTTNQGFHDVCLIRTDENGDSLWTKTYGGLGDDYAYSIIAANDGGYIITGLFDIGGGATDVYLIRIDSQGNTLWTKTYGGPYVDVGTSIQQLFDDGYVVTGTWGSTPGTQGQDVCLLRLDSIGDSLWIKIFGGEKYDMGKSVQQTSDSGFIIAGESSSFTGGSDIYLIRTDRNGDSLWTRVYGDSLQFEYCNSVLQNTEGNFIVAGFKYNLSDHQSFLMEVDSNGDTVWMRTYGGDDMDKTFSLQQTSDGGYILVGITYQSSRIIFNVYIIRTNNKGDTLWTKTFDGGWGSSIKETSDGGYIIAGSSEPQDVSGSKTDIYLVKLGPDPIEIDKHPHTNFTNKDNLNINSRNHSFKYNVPYYIKTKLRVYDPMGKLVSNLVDDWHSKGTYYVKWDSSKISNGVYFVRLSYGDYSTTGKYIKY